VAQSSDGGATWGLLRLTTPALLSGAARGTTILAEAACAAESACVRPLILSRNAGETWFETGPPGAMGPTAASDGRWWAIEGTEPKMAVVSMDDAEGVWQSKANPCNGSWPGPVSLSFVSEDDGFVACVGDSGAGQEAKEILATSDAGRTWSVAASIGVDGANVAGSLPGHGQLTGIWMTGRSAGWLATDVLYATKDGARTWTALNLGASSDSRRVISAGLDGTGGATLIVDSAAKLIQLMGTDDGGLTWRLVASWPLPPG
jgi:hypothetical protein